MVSNYQKLRNLRSVIYYSTPVDSYSNGTSNNCTIFYNGMQNTRYFKKKKNFKYGYMQYWKHHAPTHLVIYEIVFYYIRGKTLNGC